MKKILSTILCVGLASAYLPANVLAKEITFTYPALNEVVTSNSITPVCSVEGASYFLDGEAISLSGDALDLSAIPYGEHYLAARDGADEGEVRFILAAPGQLSELLALSTFDTFDLTASHKNGIYPGTKYFGNNTRRIYHTGTNDADVYPVTTGASVAEFNTLTTDSAISAVSDRGFGVCVRDVTAISPVTFSFQIGNAKWDGTFVNAEGVHDICGQKIISTDVYFKTKQDIYLRRAGFSEADERIVSADGKIGDVEYPIGKWTKLVISFDYDKLTYSISFDGEVVKQGTLDGDAVADMRYNVQNYTNTESRIYEFTFNKPTEGTNLVAFDNFAIAEPSDALAYVADMYYAIGGDTVYRTDWEDDKVKANAGNVSMVLSGNLDANQLDKLSISVDGNDFDGTITQKGRVITITPAESFADDTTYTFTIDADATCDGVVFGKETVQRFNTSAVTESILYSPAEGSTFEEGVKSTMDIKAQVAGATEEVSAEIDGTVVKTWPVAQNKLYEDSIILPELALGTHTLTLSADGVVKLTRTFEIIPEVIEFEIVSPRTGGTVEVDSAEFTITSPEDTTQVDLYFDNTLIATTTERGAHGVSKITVPEENMKYGKHVAYAIRTLTDDTTEKSESIIFTALKQSTEVEFSEDFEEGIGALKLNQGGNNSVAKVEDGKVVLSEGLRESGKANPYLYAPVAKKDSTKTVILSFDLMYANDTDSFDTECKSSGTFYVISVLKNNTIGGTTTSPNKWYHINLTYDLPNGAYTIEVIDEEGKISSQSNTTGNKVMDEGTLKINYYNLGVDGGSQMYIDNLSVTNAVRLSEFDESILTLPNTGVQYEYANEATMDIYAQVAGALNKVSAKIDGVEVYSWPINYSRIYSATIDVPTTLAIGEHTLTIEADGVEKLLRPFRVIPEIGSIIYAPTNGAEVEQYTQTTLDINARVAHAKSKVTLELDGKEVYTWSVAKDKIYTGTIALDSALALGSHTLVFKADGNTEATGSFEIVPQRVRIVSPSTGANFPTAEAVFTVAVPDDTAKIDLYIDGDVVATSTENGAHRMASISISPADLCYGQHKAYAVRTSTTGERTVSDTVTFSAIKQLATVDHTEDFDNGFNSMIGNSGSNGNVAVKGGILEISEQKFTAGLANPYVLTVIANKGTDSTVEVEFDFNYKNPTDKMGLEAKSNGDWYSVYLLDGNKIGSIATEPNKWYHIKVTFTLANGGYIVDLFDADGKALGSYTTTTGNTKLDAGNFKINYWNMGDGTSSILVDNYIFTDSVAYPYFIGSGYYKDGKATKTSSIVADADMVLAYLANAIDPASITTDKIALYANGQEVPLLDAGYNSNLFVWAKPATKLPEGAAIKLVAKIGARFADGNAFDRNMAQTMSVRASSKADAAIIASTGEAINDSSTVRYGSGVCAKVSSAQLGDSFTAVIAAYDGNKLVGIAFSNEVKKDGDEYVAISDSVTVDRKGLTFKAVAINNLSQRVPLTGAISVKPNIEEADYSGIVFLDQRFDELDGISVSNSSPNTVAIAERAEGDKCLHIVRKGNLNNVYFDTKINSNFLDRLVALDSYVLSTQIKVDESNGVLDLLDLKSTEGKWYTLGRLDGSGNLSVQGSKVGTISKGEWHKLSFVFDNTTSKLACYIDSKLAKDGIAYDSNFAIALFRCGLELTSGDNIDIYLDNIRLYEGTDVNRVVDGVTTDLGYVMEKKSAVDRIISDGDIVIAPGAGSVYFNSQKEYYKSDLLYDDNGVGYVSGGLIQKLTGVNTTSISSSVKPVVIKGKTYYPIIDTASSFGKNVYEDPRGVIYITDSPFTARDSEGVENLSDAVDVVERFMLFERPDADTIIADLKANIGTAHPRVLATEAEYEAIKEKVSSNSLCTTFKNSVITNANKYIGATLPAYELETGDAPNILKKSRGVMDKARTLSMAYKLTGNTKYADEAFRVAQNAASYPDWCDSTHFLSTAEMAYGFAIIYDVFYDYYTPAQRKVLTDAVVEKALKKAIKAYQGTHSNGYWVNGDDNWTAICPGGILAACVAMYDDEAVAPYAKELLPLTVQSFEYIMQLLYPDGAWYESVSYLTYTMKYLCAGMGALMNSNGGNYYGLFDAPGVDRVGNYFIGGIGTVEGAFNYHDGSKGQQVDPAYLWYANVVGDTQFVGAFMNLVQYDWYKYPEAFLVYYDPSKHNENFEYPKDVYLRETDIGSMRNGWTQGDIWAAVHAGKNGIDHDHLDLGEFILEADYTRWIVDWGADSYALPNYFREGGYNIYRKRPEANNCIMINPREGYQGQSISCSTSLESFVSNDATAFMIFDLTNAYRADVKSYKRGFMLGDNRTSFTVRDEIGMNGTNEVYWFANINNGISASVDGNKVTLTKGEYSMSVEFALNTSDYEISIVPCTPLSTSPIVEGQADDSKYNKIQVRAKGTGNINITAQFVPGSTTTPTTSAKNVKALVDWK